MPVFKRSELTPDMLKQWEHEAQQEIIYNTAPSIFDLSMSIAEKTGGKVDMREDDEIWVDGWPYSYWRKQGDMFVEYMPPYIPDINTPESCTSAKIVRGPWK